MSNPSNPVSHNLEEPEDVDREERAHEKATKRILQQIFVHVIRGSVAPTDGGRLLRGICAVVFGYGEPSATVHDLFIEFGWASSS